MSVSFKGAHFPTEVILMGVRWYVVYPLSTRHVEELMAERGMEMDHSTINRWVIKYSPQLEDDLPPPQARGVGELALRRNVYHSERRMAVSLPCRGQIRQGDRLSLYEESGQRGSTAVSEESNSPERLARDDHH